MQARKRLLGRGGSMRMTTSDDQSAGGYQTYKPEYADLSVKENSLMGTKGRQCPECGSLGETDAKIALERDDGTYSLWVVWYCEDDDLLWRASSRPTLALWTTVTTHPELHGYEVVGHE